MQKASLWHRFKMRPLVAALALCASVCAMADGLKPVSVPAGDLTTALELLEKQSGAEIVYRPELLKGLRTGGVKGTLSPQEAVTQLLKGTKLTIHADKSGVLLITGTDGAAPAGDSSPPGTGKKQGEKSRTDRAAPAQSSSIAKEEPGQQDSQKEPIEMHEVVVTGSRIRGAPPASPVITVTQEDMARAGYADLGDAGRGILQNFSGGVNPGIAGGGDQGGYNNLDNASALNLRGLGPDATLTLVNGHRIAYDAVAQGVDISAIPIAAVERVEVVTDGASALYGSDAVAGVANVILRREFDGVEASVKYGGSTDGGNQQQRYSITTGGSWTSGGVMMALDDSHYTAINASDRSYTSTLYGTQSLVPEQEQRSAVVAGHQNLAEGLELEWDAYLNDRTSDLTNDFTTTAPVTTSGIHNLPRVESYELTPTLRYQLGGGWEASLSGTYAHSKTATHSQFFSQGAELYRTFLGYDNDMTSAELNAEGPVFAAPGGDARLAVGSGYRSAGLDANVVRTTGGVSATTKNFNSTQDVYYGYGELSIPLVSPSQNLSFAHALTFNAAVRNEDYKGISDVTTPKLGLIFEPTANVTLRGTWGKSFKAATLYQENTAPSAYLLPATYYTPPPSGGGPVLTLGGGSPTPLQPERATTWTTSLGFHPNFLAGLTVEATYFDIRYRDRIAVPVSPTLTALGNPIYNQFIIYNPTAQQVLNAIAGLPTGLSNQTGQPFDPANVGAIIEDFLSNVASVNARGVDLSANYSMDIGADSRLSLTTSASYLESERQLSAGQPTLQLAGLIFNPPHWRARASATWQRANLTVTSAVNYLGGESDNRYLPVEWIGSFTTFDATAQIKSTANEGFLQNCEVGLSALNVFNKKPAIIRNSNPTDPPYDSLNYSVVGRFLGVSFTKRF
ncbi:MAG: TonB-dependent receptor [Rudaea sp.]|uniref:TonB-dependent receptor domain-containing protein n=1 Tax=Rudaea sp. TaxID=2136325 RepID=UPI0039E50AD2